MKKLCQGKGLRITAVFREEIQWKENTIWPKQSQGTQSYHYFEALQKHNIAIKWSSVDADIAFIYSCCLSYATCINVNLANYVACKYADGTVLLGNVPDINECEAVVKFLHPRFSAATYYWPEWDDFCIVSICNICITDIPNISGRSGSLYKLLMISKTYHEFY